MVKDIESINTDEYKYIPKYDLYPIIIDELLKMYFKEDSNTNINSLYKYLYIKCSIIKGNKKVSDRDLMKFILDELNIDVFTADKEGKSTSAYVLYEDGRYCNYEWNSEFMDSFKFRVEMEGEMDLVDILEDVYSRGYKKAVKYKKLNTYRDYIKYYRLMTLNETFGVKKYYPKGVDGFTEGVNHNPFKRSIEEEFEARLVADKLLGSNTTTHISEEDLEDYLVDHIELIEEGMSFIRRQVTVPGGIVDIIAKDKNGDICIIEVKINDDKSIIWQALHYPKEIKKLYRSENIRMITVAPSYPEHILSALKSLGNVETMSYQIKVSSGNIVNLMIKGV